MIKYFYLTLVTSLVTSLVFAQTNYNKKADSLYHAKSYAAAGYNYILSAQHAEFGPLKRRNFYDAACCYALANQADSAMILLRQSVKLGYENVLHIKQDDDLISLRQRPDFNALVANIHPRVNSTPDPTKAKLITTDVSNFWNAFDRVQKDTAHAYDIYKKYYIAPGTPGLQDYFAYKVNSLKNFIQAHKRKQNFYASLRKNTYMVDQQKPQMMASFVKFKEIYPDVVFPNIYFIIGAFTSGGTSTDNGLLIGLDQAVRTPDIPVGELTLWEKNNFSDLQSLPNLIVHELVHYNQMHMASDTTLLHAVLVEGMADFIGELASGKTANERLQVWAKGREKQIWADFEKEIYLNRGYNWIANAQQETADKPADLGYWVGYQICKAYYNQATDKKQAVADMLHLKDYKAFYIKSGASTLFK